MDLVKLEKEISKSNESFCGEVRGMTVDQVKERIVMESQNLGQVREAKESDEDLNEAKELVKEYSAPYRDSMKAINNKLKFLVEMLKEKTEV